MIGYSLGGLIVRFAIGVLGQKGFFDTIEPDVRRAIGVIGWIIETTVLIFYFNSTLSPLPRLI